MTDIAKQVMAALSTVDDPELHRDLVSLGMIRNLEITAAQASFTVVLTTPACPLKSVIENNCRQAVLSRVSDIKEVKVAFDAKVQKPVRKKLPIGHLLAVASGKGGVGKSTVSVNLALALAATGASVGILDADVYGPNLPIMLGLDSLPPMEEEQLVPGRIHGVSLMSIGYMVDADQALMWRGPMLHNAIQKMLHGCKWPELDYLIIDMPPGTGDAQMSVAQSTTLSAGLVVTAPQKVAVADARRGVTAFQLLKVPIVGVVENMSGDTFGTGGGEEAAQQLELPFLGRIPLDGILCQAGDSGLPLMVKDPSHPIAEYFSILAGKIAATLSVLAYQQQLAGKVE